MGRTAFLLLLPALVACADLSPIPEEGCGNAVLNPKEDCDTEVDVSLGGGTACGDNAGPELARCRYVCTGETLCPLGWDCGADAICRQPSQELHDGEPIPDWSPISFEPVDFNGDGRTDLVGAFDGSIEFRVGEAGGKFAEASVRSTYPVTGDVSVGNLDSDSLADVLLPTERGFLVWRGQATGAPLPVAYASYDANGTEKLRLIPVALDEEEEVLIIFGQGSNTPPIAGCVYDGVLGTCNNNLIPAYGVDDIGERFAVADFDRDGSEEITIGFHGASALRIFGVAQSFLTGGYVVGGLGGSVEPLEVDVSEAYECDGCSVKLLGLTIASGVHAVDVDGDGSTDLMVGLVGEALSGEAVAVARGDGAGGFEVPYLDPRFALLAEQSTAAGHAGELSVWPIAAGDLDADGDADYVSQHGLFLAGIDGLDQIYMRVTQYPWTFAVITDIDGYGDADVVAIRNGERQVDVVRGASDGSGWMQRGDPYLTKLTAR